MMIAVNHHEGGHFHAYSRMPSGYQFFPPCAIWSLQAPSFVGATSLMPKPSPLHFKDSHLGMVKIFK